MAHSAAFRVRAKFSPEEDERLRSLVSSFGTADWLDIAAQMPGKNVRQCKERWTNYLAPTLNASTWTHEEDCLLVQKYAELGSKWVQIAAFFPNRTDSMIKNRFNKLSRREQKRRELFVRGDFAFAIPLFQCALTATTLPTAPIQRFPEVTPEPEPKVQISDSDSDKDFGSDLWLEPTCFMDEMFSFE
jgi:hypothetical protein